MTFTFEIEKAQLNAVLRAFTDTHAHYHDPKIVDTTELMVGYEKVARLVKKLTALRNGAGDKFTLSMTSREWLDYTRVIDRAGHDLPSLSQNDLEILEQLCETYIDWDDQGITPGSA